MPGDNAIETQPQPSVWQSVREAIRGSEQDYTTGSLKRAIFLLAVPMVLEMAMESLFAVVDVFFVARLGSDATATVALAESVLTLVFAVAIGLSSAATATIARRIGEKNPDEAAVAAVQAIIAGVAVSIVLSVAGYAYSEQILRAMGASPSVVAIGTNYTRVLLGGCGSVVLLFLLNAIFRGAGDAAIAMRVLWLGNIINMVLDPCLIFGLGPFPELGLTGASTATVIGRSTAVGFQIWVLLRGKGRIVVRPRHIRVAPDVLARLVRISIPGTFQYAIATTSWVGLVRIISLFGSDALAGYAIAVRVIVFAILPSWGLSNAAATLVGQSLGANKPDRAEESVWLTGMYNAVFLGSIAVLFITFGEPVLRLFTTDPAVLQWGVQCLRIISYGYPFYAFGMVIVQAFNGAGDTLTPTIVNLFCFWMLEIPLAYTLALPAGLGPTGVFWSISIAESSLTVVATLIFRRGRWKRQRV